MGINVAEKAESLKVALIRQMTCDRIGQCYPKGVPTLQCFSLGTLSVPVCHGTLCPLSPVSCCLYFCCCLHLQKHIAFLLSTGDFRAKCFSDAQCNSKVLNKHRFQRLFKYWGQTVLFTCQTKRALSSLRSERT